MEVSNQTIIDIDRSIAGLDEVRNQHVQSQNEINLKLSKLNASVNGTILPRHRYEAICVEQNKLKSKKILVESAIAEIKRQIKNKQLLRQQVQLDLESNAPKPIGVKLKLVELRDKYMAFSSDNTRIASTRAMASRFSEELESLLKAISLQ